jgi:hypothetical protein
MWSNCPAFSKISKVLQGSKNKQEVENDLLSTSAPLNVESCNQMNEISALKVLQLNSNVCWIGE